MQPGGGTRGPDPWELPLETLSQVVIGITWGSLFDIFSFINPCVRVCGLCVVMAVCSKGELLFGPWIMKTYSWCFFVSSLDGLLPCRKLFCLLTPCALSLVDKQWDWILCFCFACPHPLWMILSLWTLLFLLYGLGLCSICIVTLHL